VGGLKPWLPKSYLLLGRGIVVRLRLIMRVRKRFRKKNQLIKVSKIQNIIVEVLAFPKAFGCLKYCAII
jgi:hypothetical protein